MPWIDSVCVDEDIDHLEKRGQALLARDVYSQASRVVVWLGHCEYSELAIAQMKNLLSYNRKYVGTLANLSSPIRDPESISGRALRRFLNPPWFKRVWAVQPVGLAENVHLLWGGKYLDWGSLKLIITLLSDPQLLDSLNDTADSNWIIARVIRIRDELRGSKVMPLSDLLIFCSALQTSDLRDKVLALQGISCSKSHLNLI